MKLVTGPHETVFGYEVGKSKEAEHDNLAPLHQTVSPDKTKSYNIH